MFLGRSAVIVATIAVLAGCGSVQAGPRRGPAVPGDNPTGYTRGGFPLDPTLRHEEVSSREPSPQRDLDQQRLLEEERERREMEQERQMQQQQRDIERSNIGGNDPDRCMSCR